MGNIKPVFTNKGASPVPTYDFIDAVSGVGYATYYCVNTGTKTFNKQAIASQIPCLQTDIASASMVLISEIDWDLTYTRPTILAAAPIIVSCTVEKMVAIGIAHQTRLDLEIIHVAVGGAETSLATATGDVANIGSTIQLSVRLTTLATPSANKKFKAGEKLRITTFVYAMGVAGSNSTNFRLWTDGAGRGTSVYNQATPISPYVADLGYKNSTDIKFLVGYKPIL